MDREGFRIVFMGTPDFAVASLRTLVEEKFNVVAVVTAPDKPAGRGRQLQQSAVKKFAVEAGLSLLQPEKLKDPGFQEQLKSFRADLFVVVAFRMLPESVWAMPPKGTINLHASLLPEYRGAAPINHVIINGEKETGVTTFFIEKDIDTGNILFQEKIKINTDDNAGSLHDKLMVCGAQLIRKTVDAIRQDTYTITAQDQLIGKGSAPKNAPKIFREDCKISWKLQGMQVYNFIRGLSPYPAAWSMLRLPDSGTLTLKIYEAEFYSQENKDAPGMIDSDNKTYLHIAVNDGFMKILTLQLEGKKRMEVCEFLRGFQNIQDCKILAET